MNIEKIIEELRAERERLNWIIVALERLGGADEGMVAAKRRGRKFMDKQDRKEVSERMKKYWAARREASGSRSKEAAESASAAGAGEMNDPTDSSDEGHVIAA